MHLCLDLGNTNCHGGVFSADDLQFTFRHKTSDAGSSDDLGLFLKSVLSEHQLETSDIKKISICSVVPTLDHSLSLACIKYFDLEPNFLNAETPSLNFKNNYDNPSSLGADRVANLVAVQALYPNQNSLIVDMGTATTVCALTKDAEFKGGVIIPGLALIRDALQAKAAQLPEVEIKELDRALATSTVPGVQSGLYFGHLGSVKEVVSRLKQELFAGEECHVIASGGFSRLYQNQFDHWLPNLTLQGLNFSGD